MYLDSERKFTVTNGLPVALAMLFNWQPARCVACHLIARQTFIFLISIEWNFVTVAMFLFFRHTF